MMKIPSQPAHIPGVCRRIAASCTLLLIFLAALFADIHTNAAASAPPNFAISGSAWAGKFQAQGTPPPQTQQPTFNRSPQAGPTPATQPSPTPTPTSAEEKKEEKAKPGPVQLKYPLPDLQPLGNAGPKTVEAVDPATEEFIPLPDRWRSGWPRYDRYERKQGTPWVVGSAFDPFDQNILKSDYPVFGNHTFLNLNFQSATTLNPRVAAVGGRRNEQFFTNQNFVVGAELFGGTGAFEPKRWSVRLTTVLNFNFLANNTLNLFESKRGKTRLAVEEGFVEKRLAVTSSAFDFISVRAGMQNFTSDFRGFVFTDNQLGVRLFGNAHSNRDQFNVAVFSMRQRDEASQLHTFNSRHQTVFIANWFRQDFGKKGYTALFNFHFNHDLGLTGINDRGHPLNVAYFGFHGDGRLGSFNISHAFYEAFGTDSFNRLAQRRVEINAQMAALELSKDRDWQRYRVSLFYASGDRNLNDGKANGFDMITDNPNFAGGPFMFWTQQASAIGNLGTLTNKFSLLPDLRDKFTQRSNFVNPGLMLVSGGADFRLTPKAKLVTNLSYLRFTSSTVLQQLTGNSRLGNGIGVDASAGIKYRPFENENMFFVFGTAVLLPRGGYAQLVGSTHPLVSPTVAIQFTF